jgi:hypothetical protein
MRSEIEGWTFEDGALLVRRSRASNPDKIFIGYTPTPLDIPLYTTILEMLADGWELLGPPQREECTAFHKPFVEWVWWLQRPLCSVRSARSAIIPDTDVERR